MEYYPGLSAQVKAPFDEAKEALESEGYRIISLEENAELRILEGKDAYVSKHGNYTKEAIIYLPDKRIFLTKDSPIIEYAEKATQLHRIRAEFYQANEQIEKFLKNSVRISRGNIPTNRFRDYEITNFAFGDVAKDYGLFLKDAGIKEMPIYLDNFFIDEPFTRQVWFRDLESKSGINGHSKELSNKLEVRGISENIEDLLKERNRISEKNDFYSKFKLLQTINKKIEQFTNKEMYAEALRLQIERDNLYKELR